MGLNSALYHPTPCAEAFGRGTIVSYVGGYLTTSTDAVLAANGGAWAGIATTESHIGVKRCTVQQFGWVLADITGLGAGAAGTVLSACHPVGKVRIADALIDAVAEGAFIPAGTRVKVVQVQGNRVVVTPAP